MMLGKQLDTILHLGAGRCSEFAEYETTGARRIILVEANPEAARYLRETHADDERVEVVERAVSDFTGHGELRVFNVKEFSSLREPTGLRELYPGLREVERVGVDVVSLADLVSDLEISRDRFNWLIVDAPGEEAAVSRALCSNGLADAFDLATLYAPAIAGFDGTVASSDLTATLEGCAYELQSHNDMDPDRLTVTLLRDKLRVENAELRERLVASEALASARAEEIERVSAERDELSSTVGELNEQLRSVQWDKDLHAAKASSTAEQMTRVTAERDELLDQVADLNRRVSEHSTELERRAAEQREAESQRQQATDRIAELEERLAATAKEAESRAAEVEQIKAERGELSQRVEQLDEQHKRTITEREELSEKLKQLSGERDELVQRVSSLKEQVTTIKQERDARTSEINAAKERLDAKTKEFRKLDQSKQELERMLNERDQRISQMHDEFEEWKRRQSQQRDEIVKAEGQLDVIKDLLLRERSL